MRAALAFMAEQGIDIVVTSGGLGPTADDLTAEVVGGFQGREMVLDEALERADRARSCGRCRNAGRTSTWRRSRRPTASRRRSRGARPCSSRSGPRRGSWCRRGIGARPPDRRPSPGRRSSCCRARRASCSRCGAQALETDALRAALAGATAYRQRTLRLFGIPESEIAETLRVAEREGVELGRLEITTCLKRGEVEVVTRYEPDAQDAYDAFVRVVRARHADTLFSQRRQHRRRAGGGALEGIQPTRHPRPPLAADDRHRRVVHRRPAGGAADRAGGRLRLLQGRDRRVLERGQGRPGRRGARADRDARRGLGGGRRGARRRGAGGVWARTSASGSPAWRARAAAARRSRWGSCG